jgi:hypothetical protein
MTMLSVTSIQKWAGHNNILYVAGDDMLPFIFKDGLYHYFGLDPVSRDYILLMTSLESLNEKSLSAY